jgi:type IV secretion system protein VirB8
MAKEKKEVLKLRTWYSNKYQMILLQKKLLSLFSILAMIIVVIAIIFVKKFTESKSFEPYVVEMEEKTGIINVIENLSSTSLTADESIKKFYINAFLEAAEGYNYVTYKTDRRKGLLMSSGAVFRKTMEKFNQRNERSVVNVLSNRGTLTIKIKSIVFLTPRIASVRFVVYTQGIKPTKEYPAERHLIANIEFNFVNMSLNQGDRFLNPLGFQVVKYNVGDDVNM